MTMVKRPQAGATSGGPNVEGNKRPFNSKKQKSPVRVKTGSRKGKNY